MKSSAFIWKKCIKKGCRRNCKCLKPIQPNSWTKVRYAVKKSRDSDIGWGSKKKKKLRIKSTYGEQSWNTHVGTNRQPGQAHCNDSTLTKLLAVQFAVKMIASVLQCAEHLKKHIRKHMPVAAIAWSTYQTSHLTMSSKTSRPAPCSLPKCHIPPPATHPRTPQHAPCLLQRGHFSHVLRTKASIRARQGFNI